MVAAQPSLEPGMRAYAALLSRIKAAAVPPVAWRVYGQQVTPDAAGAAERYDLLILRIPAAGEPRSSRPGEPTLRVLLNGGTHGDEPAGPEAVAAFLEQRRYRRWPHAEFVVTPCANPWGYVHDRRESPGGADLNRSFRRAGSAAPEVSLLKRALRRRPFDLFLDCHEDVDAPGFYVFAPAALGRAIVAAVAKLGPIHPGSVVDDDVPLTNAVVELDSAVMLARPEMRDWPLPSYLARYRQRPAAWHRPSRHPDGEATRETSVASESENILPPDLGQDSGLDIRRAMARVATATLETPARLPLAQRVAMHLAAIDAALEMLHPPEPR